MHCSLVVSVLSTYLEYCSTLVVRSRNECSFATRLLCTAGMQLLDSKLVYLCQPPFLFFVCTVSDSLFSVGGHIVCCCCFDGYYVHLLCTICGPILCSLCRFFVRLLWMDLTPLGMKQSRCSTPAKMGPRCPCLWCTGRSVHLLFNRLRLAWQPLNGAVPVDTQSAAVLVYIVACKSTET